MGKRVEEHNRSKLRRRSIGCPSKAKNINFLAFPNAHARSPEEKQQVVKVAEELAALDKVDQLDMTGSRWELVFTESLASSSGKIGPFVGRTEQVRCFWIGAL